VGVGTGFGTLTVMVHNDLIDWKKIGDAFRFLVTMQEPNKRWKVKKLSYVSLLMVFVFSSLAFAAEFKPYPDSRADEKATQEANQMAAGSKMGKAPKSTIYTASDSFEKVFDFYKGMAKEFKMPHQKEGKVKKLPSGQELKEAYFIFDGAGDLMGSKLWIKVQRPYIGRVKMEGYQPKYEDVRDVTAIVVAEQK
jgi:hypothetical protein